MKLICVIYILQSLLMFTLGILGGLMYLEQGLDLWVTMLVKIAICLMAGFVSWLAFNEIYKFKINNGPVKNPIEKTPEK